jgi:ArsR family transcriptional regulator
VIDTTFHLDPETCKRLSDYLAHFSNPLRLRIICLLKDGPRNVTDLVAATGQHQSTVSGQLKYLLMTGILNQERRGVNVFYSVRDEQAVAMLWHLVQAFVPEAVEK